MADKRCDIFISGTSGDAAWLLEFSAALRKEGLQPWSDVELDPGEKWADALEKALRDSTTLVMVLTPESLQNNLTFFELGAAIAGEKKIIPIIPGEFEPPRIPPILRQYKFLQEPSPGLAAKRVAEAVGRRQTPEAA